jgi:predicted Zn finger-like uncharacterized protein
MYIACPKCDTNFVVTPEQIGLYGRKVKCSKCTHIWHQRLKDQVKMEPIISAPLIAASTVTSTKLGAGVNLPALLPIKIPPFLYGLPAFLIILILFLFTILFQETVGIRPASIIDAFSIKDINIENQKDVGKVVVSYRIVNGSDDKLPMPLVRIRLLDENHRVLSSHTEVANMDFLPKQSVRIKTEFASVPGAANKIDISLGNMLDFMLR